MNKRLLIVGAMAIFASLTTVHAEDIVVVMEGTRPREYRGTVFQVDKDGVHMETKDAKSGAVLKLKFLNSTITSLTLDLGTTFDDGMKAFSAGKPAETIRLFEPLVAKYKGAVDPRVGTIMITLADAQLASGQNAKAQQLYNEYALLYPDQKSRTNVGLAKIAILDKDLNKASTLLAGIEKEAAAVNSPTVAQERTFSEAFYLLGQASEQKGDQQKALEYYLKSAVLYPGYESVADKAQARADEIRKTKNPEKGPPVVFVP